MDRQQVYRVSYDLVVYGKRETDCEPVEEALLLARDFDAALALAKAIVPELRRTAVHQVLVVRELALVHDNVVTTADAPEPPQVRC
jgi:hypothetical protein